MLKFILNIQVYRSLKVPIGSEKLMPNALVLRSRPLTPLAYAKIGKFFRNAKLTDGN
ncbi:MAG TPA: hypothetical protein VH415_03510 [Nitrososphaeraceae archaeon]|jgi:hypothetical protein